MKTVGGYAPGGRQENPTHCVYKTTQVEMSQTSLRCQLQSELSFDLDNSRYALVDTHRGQLPSPDTTRVETHEIR